MQKILYTIRSRSLKDRQKIVYGSAFVVTLLICGIWLSLLEFDKHKEVDSSIASDQFGPLKSLKSGFKNMWSNAKYSVSEDTEKAQPAATDLPKEDTKNSPSANQVQKNEEGQIILEPQPIDSDPSTPSDR